jgi:hypothetical protein
LLDFVPLFTVFFISRNQRREKKERCIVLTLRTNPNRDGVISDTYNISVEAVMRTKIWIAILIFLGAFFGSVWFTSGHAG